MNPLADDYAPTPADERLVELAVAGDPGAASELVRRHQRWIYNLALRVLQSPTDAADATQESLINGINADGTRLPLGVLALHCWTRETLGKSKENGRKLTQRQYAQRQGKESDRWAAQEHLPGHREAGGLLPDGGNS
jgi:hypothetical protein